MENFSDLTVLNFIAECNEFVEGKFLFAGQKLERIYNVALDSPALVELFLQCSEDFKYSLEMTKAFIKTPTKPGTFTAPKEADKFLALVFGILKEINEQVINFNVFVPKYFSEDSKIPPTQAFANQIIIPFKNLVAKYFELNENNKEHFSRSQIDEQMEQKQLERQQNEETLTQENQNEDEKEANLESEQQQEILNKEPNGKATLISNLEEDIKTYKVTYEDLMEAMKMILTQMLENLRSAKLVLKKAKSDGIFVLSRALRLVEKDDIEGIYSEILTIRYMRRHLFVLRKEIKELFEIFSYFEKL